MQLCVSNEWRQVCAMSWNKDDAGVVCHQLGYGRTGELVHEQLMLSYLVYCFNVY